MTGLHRPPLAQLFQLHVQARGEQVTTPEAADLVFKCDRI